MTTQSNFNHRKENRMNSYNKYPRGSEWRKWDLHFHTPSSFDYGDNSVTDNDIVDTLIENEIAVVAITDHHVIDVDRIRNLQALGGEHLTVLPGIELRADVGGSTSIHFIGIFPENCDLDRLWTEIQGKLGLHPNDVKEKGDDRVYCRLRESAELFHDLGGIVTIHAGGKANSLEKIVNTYPEKQAQKTDILSYIDMLELGKPKDAIGYLEKVFPALNLERPLIICSDNHNIRKYILKENCWIKAEPNFEGLRQVLFEPMERVRIQTNFPHELRPYRVIDKIRFISDKNDFQDSYIHLNPLLNVIIGGKSTGKTLLLNMTAKTINHSEVKRVHGKLKRNSSYRFEERDDFDFEVVWKDGHTQRLSSIKSEDVTQRDITFIPQSFIHVLSEPEAYKTGVELRSFILDVVRQNPEADSVYREFDQGWKKNQSNIELLIQSLFSEIKQHEQHCRDLTTLGDKGGVEKYICQLNEEISELKNESGMSEDDMQNYQDLMAKEKQAIQNKKEAISSKEMIHNFITEGEIALKLLIEKRDNLTESIQNDKMKEQFEEIANIVPLQEVFKELRNKFIEPNLSGEMTTTESEIEFFENQIVDIDREIQPLRDKVSFQNELIRKEENVKKEEQRLSDITIKEKQISDIETSIESYKTQILKSYEQMYEYYCTTVDKLNDICKSIHDIQVIGSVKFYANRFSDQFISGHINLNRSRSFRNLGLLSSPSNTISQDTHFLEIKKLFEGVLSGEIARKKYSDKKEAVSALLRDNFFTDWTIEYKGDKLESMSPGKANHALLSLLVELTENDSPILIDQPEDDLDNRSIFYDLVKFLRRRKEKRQLIIVTHNPNIVVGTDAECVIVANQDGQEEGRTNSQYRFEYVTGALENTKKRNNQKDGILNQMGIREHVCEILEGGKQAFQLREQKYGFQNK